MSKTIEWLAFCFTCEGIVSEGAPNGLLVEGDAKAHIRNYPKHQVVVGYIVKAEEGEGA